MRILGPSLVLLLSALALSACNTVRGAGEDIRSVGRVFTDHPDGPAPRRR